MHFFCVQMYVSSLVQVEPVDRMVDCYRAPESVDTAIWDKF